MRHSCGWASKQTTTSLPTKCPKTLWVSWQTRGQKSMQHAHKLKLRWRYMAHATQKKDQILQNTIAQQFFGININAIANPIYGM
jgi:hypothetical protein